MTPARPTVGRPAEQARREEILAVAETIIGQRGYVRTSLSDIAEAAGMQAGSLYHHFESKEALAAEIVERMHDDLNRSVAEFDVTAREPADALREFARTVGVVSDRHRAAVLLSAFDAPANAGGRLSGLVRLEQPALDRTWNALIARVESSGLFRAGVDPGLVSFALSHGSWEVGMHALTRLSPTDMADQFCSILLDGVLTDRQATEGLDDSPASAVVETIVSRWEDTPPSPSDRRGLVLEAGRTEFARRGFTASTMRDVALAADMRVAGVYRIFPSKDALLEAIIGAFSSTLLDGFGQVTAAARTPVEALDGLLGLMAYAGLHFRREFAIVRTWWRVEAPSAPAAALAGNGERYSVLRSVITDGLASSALRPTADVDLYATCIRELMWMPFPQADGVTPAQARDFLRTTVESGALRF